MQRKEEDRRKMEEDKRREVEKDRRRLEDKKKREEELERRRAEEELLEQHKSKPGMARSPVEKIVAEQESDSTEGEEEGRNKPMEGVKSGEEEEQGAGRGSKRGREELTSPRVMLKRTRSLEDRGRSRSGKDGDPFETVTELVELMDQWLRTQLKQKTASKARVETLSGIMGEVKEQVRKMQVENERLKGRLEGRAEVMKLIEEMKGGREDRQREEVETEGGRRGYAEVVRGGDEEWKTVMGRRGRTRPTPKVVVIRQEGKESDEVRRQVRSLVNPREDNLKVRRLTGIRNGVALELDTQEEVDRLIANERVKGAGMTVEMPRKRRPVVILYDVPGNMKNETVKEEIYERNLEGDISREKYEEGFEIKTRRGGVVQGRGNRLTNVVVEVSAEVRRQLLGRERVYVEWQCCRIRDYMDFARCYQCQGHGHVAKHCRNKRACPRCAGEHDVKECKQEEQAMRKCINCQKEGRVEDEHDARDRECQSYRKAEERYKRTLDYGD